MSDEDFYYKYDEGTLTKLLIFRLYTREWLPVFLSKPHPDYKGVHIFDFFCGSGSDSVGSLGSPLITLDELRACYQSGKMQGWGKSPLVVHFFDKDKDCIHNLQKKIESEKRSVSGVEIDCRELAFENALQQYNNTLSDNSIAKLLIIDPFGVKEMSADVFKKLVSFPVTDFIFFIPSEILNRFRDHPSIKQKIKRPDDPYHVHRAVIEYYREQAEKTANFFLSPFAIKKENGRLYGLVFGAKHLRGVMKFLKIAWKCDPNAGEANFDIQRDNLSRDQSQGTLFEMRSKVSEFQEELENVIREKKIKDERDLIYFCGINGMTCQHCKGVLEKLIAEDVIESAFIVPNPQKLKTPRVIKYL
jgi:three-Cys-motif partner protein